MKKRKQPPRPETVRTDIISGTLRMHPKGFGFVIPHPIHGLIQDVFIPKHLTDSAIDGDTVEVAILDNPLSEKGPEGKITAVTKRSKDHLCGTIQKENADGSFSAYMPILGSTKPVLLAPSDKIPVRIGSRVVVKVVEWGNTKESTKGEILYCLGSIDDPSCDMKAAIEEFDLSPTFPQKVISQAKS
ncbi:MAG: ribonuclease R, partial [Chlamydiia bacterium]|nr:ribonuclease R [Chlamydiia bacterium]